MDYSELSDNEVVECTLSEPELFGVLIDRYEPKLSRYIRRITNVSADDVEDLLQDIFIKAYQNLKGFDTKLSFSSWIYRIAHNTVISGHRKRESRPQTMFSDISADRIELFVSNLKTDSAVLEQQDKAFLEKILSTLPIKYKEVLVLRYFEEYSYEEISDILKKPPGTVATLLNRAKKKLKQTISTQV